MSDSGEISPDVEAIRSVIATYQRAGSEGDSELYRDAFHPGAMVSHPTEDGDRLIITSLDAFIAEVADMLEQGSEVSETARKLHIDVAGDVASARIDFTLRLGLELFEGTDFVSFARLNGRWMMVHKLYEMRPNVET